MRGRRDEGSISLEYVIVAPLFLILFAVIWAFARVGQLHDQLDSATRDAARQVTQLADLSTAQSVAYSTIEGDLASGSGGCIASSLVVTVTPAAPAPGDTITVLSSCRYHLSDLGFPFGGTGDFTASAKFSSLVDPNRTA